jgi:hypothetical protein
LIFTALPKLAVLMFFVSCICECFRHEKPLATRVSSEQTVARWTCTYDSRKLPIQLLLHYCKCVIIGTLWNVFF